MLRSHLLGWSWDSQHYERAKYPYRIPGIVWFRARYLDCQECKIFAYPLSIP